jgi:glycosyltransferase involved in cell wall biosynthesis
VKVVFNHHSPFSLAHGGTQIQIERTKAALEATGVEAEYMEWWNEKQSGDILHQVGWLHPEMIRLAQNKGWKVVITTLLTQQCNRSEREWLTRQVLIRSLLGAPLPRRWKLRLPWQCYHLCDQVIVGLEAERHVLEKLYGVESSRISVIPLGLTETFLGAGPPLRTENHLICTGTIGPLKNSVALARLAREAGTPILFVGKPFDYSSGYWEEFKALIDDQIIRHHPHVGTEAGLVDLLRQARGYVLMSQYENWSLAAHEAAACGLPLLLPDQRWSRERFGDRAAYFPTKGRADAVAALRTFYDQCPKLAPPGIKLYNWREVAEMLRAVYQKLLTGSA